VMISDSFTLSDSSGIINQQQPGISLLANSPLNNPTPDLSMCCGIASARDWLQRRHTVLHWALFRYKTLQPTCGDLGCEEIDCSLGRYMH